MFFLGLIKYNNKQISQIGQTVNVNDNVIIVESYNAMILIPKIHILIKKPTKLLGK